MTRQELKKLFSSPAYTKDNLAVIVERFYTDVNGTLVNKNDVIAAIPALECDTPIYLFAEYDRQGGYILSRKFYPAPDALKFMQTFVYGVTNPFFFGANVLTDVQNKCKPGDILQVYTDNILAPTYYVWVRVACSMRSIASFQENLPMMPKETEYGPIYLESLKYYSTNVLQWTQEMQILWADYIGLASHNYADPIIFRGPRNFDNGFVQMNIKTLLSQYVGFNTYMLFDTDSMNYTFNFSINKQQL